jgi:hypothetical protein
MWATGKLGEKFQTSALRKRKQNVYPLEEIATQEAVIQIEAKAGGKIKTDLCIACSMSET